MTNAEITSILRNVAASYAIKDEGKYRFQIIAYNKAADAVERSTIELKNLMTEEKLDQIDGIGASMARNIEELLATGESKHFAEVMKDVPSAVFPLLMVPSFGPKKAYKLVTHFGLENPATVIDDVLRLANENKIASLPSFGEKSQADIIKSIESYKMGASKTARMVLPYATELAEQLLTYLKQSEYVIEAYPLGSLRRQVSTIGDIDIAVATHHPEEVLEYFTKYPHKERVLEKGDATSSILVGAGKHIDLMVQPPERFGSLLQHFTGSKNHNVHLREYALKKGLSLSEYGIKKITDANKDKKVRESDDIQTFRDEKKFYEALGLQWIPPEMREDTGEIELALKGELPKPVELKDIKGDFHLHSSYPIEPSHDMGKDSFEVMLRKAKELGYDYVGFSEHNPSTSKHTKEQILSILSKRKAKIDQLNSSNKYVRVFTLLETDILASGKLAIPDEAFEYLDASLVSIHSSFSMNKTDMTKRVLDGLAHPKAKILAHPTGRLINQRPGYDLDWEKIFDFVVKNNKALEINSSPLRLDLPDALVREAIKYGVKFFIDTDSHEVNYMDMMRYGVSVARRGFATKHDILNTYEYNKLENWFKS
jgi:DNA polymerase (family X)